MDIQHQDTIDAFERISACGDASALYGKHAQTQIFSDFETGRIGAQEFIAGLREKLGVESEVSDQILVDAWMAMLKDHPSGRVDYLRHLRTRKRVFMLSNINEIHEEYLERFVASRGDIADFYSLFEKVYFSHRIGLRKPEPEAFLLVVKENNLDPERTLFVDDTLGHVEAAKKVGLKGLLLDPPNRFVL